MQHLPNALTAFRLVSAPVLAALLCGGAPGWQAEAAFALFAVAAVTDHLDGFLARRFDAESEWGRQLDPLADKMLIAAALLGLSVSGALGGVHLVAVALILGRELAISAARELLAHRGADLPVTGLARLKTTVQSIAVGLLLMAPLAGGLAGAATVAGLAGLWLAAGLTAWTGAQYLRRAHGLLRRAAEPAP